ncbi:MAG: PaaI family thioesterase [Alphaproteobacteria bacterium]|jgi:uncharacterized protein (TIGR00369 family)
MTNETILAGLNVEWPPCVAMLQGHATDYDLEARRLTMGFTAIEAFCHSGNVVQGGYTTAMIDAVMAYAAMGLPDFCDGVATLEIKVSFMAPGRPGPMVATGRIVGGGRSIGYLDGDLHQDGKLIATATSTVKFLRARTD